MEQSIVVAYAYFLNHKPGLPAMHTTISNISGQSFLKQNGCCKLGKNSWQIVKRELLDSLTVEVYVL